jgi:lipopolysaccharide export LptBFGC system permease protein LptF
MRIHRYFALEATPAFATALLLVAGLAVVVSATPRLSLVAGAPGLAMFSWLVTLAPQALLQSSPLALTLAVVTTFGRWRQDREWLALQAGGVARRHLFGRTLSFALLLCSLVLAANQWLLPAANTAALAGYEDLLANQSSLFRVAAQRVPVPGLSLRSERVLADGTLLGVRLERWDGSVYTLVRAERGRLEGRELRLWDHHTQRFDFTSLSADPAVGNPERILRLDARASGETAPLVITTGVDEGALLAGFGSGGYEDARALTQLYADAHDSSLSSLARREANVLMHRRLAEAVAHLSLLLLGLPLVFAFGGSRTQALGIGLLLVLTWYLLYAGGQTLALAGVLPAWLGVWLANGLFSGLGGAWLLVGLRG